MLYSRSLKLSSLLKILFYFLLLWVRFTALSSSSVILSSASSHLFLNLSSLFSIQLLYSLICDFCLVSFYVFYFFLTVFTFSLSSVVFPSSASIFVTILWTLYQIYYLFPFHSISFFSWSFYFVLFLGQHIALFPHFAWLSVFVSMY